MQPVPILSRVPEPESCADGRKPPGHVFWLFGHSGAGKTTLADLLSAALPGMGLGTPLALDGDRLRAGLCAGLGFSVGDRTENLRRAAEVARLGVESGLVVVAAFITPLEAQRCLIAGLVGENCLSWIHVEADFPTRRRRDVKGLYARAEAGLVPEMTGVSARFEAPERWDLHLRTDDEPVAVSAERLQRFVWDRIQVACRS